MESNEARKKYYATEEAVASLEAAYESVEVVQYAPEPLLSFPGSARMPTGALDTPSSTSLRSRLICCGRGCSLMA